MIDFNQNISKFGLIIKAFKLQISLAIFYIYDEIITVSKTSRFYL